jgi:hypothetical protein
MIDDVPAVVPPRVAAVGAVTPSPEPPAAGESTLPAPTAEQAQAADRVFTVPSQHHPAATLLGVLASALLLRDVAVDTVDTSGDEEEAEKELDENKDAQPRR